MTIPGYDYDKAIPAGFYDEIHQRKAGVRFFWHDLKFRAVQIDYANRRYGSAEHRFSTQVLADLDERFDAITMIELIEHLPPADARRLLAEARGLLSPQGRLVVTTPNYRSLWP